MKPLIKQLLRESLLQKEEPIQENFKSFLAGLLMMTGLSWGQIKPEYKAKIDSIQKTTLSPQEKRAEIQKIVQMNRDEITGKKREEFLRNMAAAGFTDEELYKAYLKKLAKKKNVGLDGLETDKACKRGEKKGSCSTGQTMGGDSLKDTN